jgi:hypothetical protein
VGWASHRAVMFAIVYSLWSYTLSWLRPKCQLGLEVTARRLFCRPQVRATRTARVHEHPFHAQPGQRFHLAVEAERQPVLPEAASRLQSDALLLNSIGTRTDALR